MTGLFLYSGLTIHFLQGSILRIIQGFLGFSPIFATRLVKARLYLESTRILLMYFKVVCKPWVEKAVWKLLKTLIQRDVYYSTALTNYALTKLKSNKPILLRKKYLSNFKMRKCQFLCYVSEWVWDNVYVHPRRKYKAKTMFVSF